MKSSNRHVCEYNTENNTIMILYTKTAKMFTFLGSSRLNSQFPLKHVSYVSTIIIMDVSKQENRPSGNL